MSEKTITCAKCGKEFTFVQKAGNHSRKYCQDCTTCKKPKEKPRAVNERLDAKVRAAQRLGISYGEWTALFEGR